MLRRYVNLWFGFLKMSWMADLEYRANIAIRVCSEFFWYAMQLSVFEVLYTHTDSISGWDVHDMRVFMGTLFVVDVLYMILLSENLDHFTSLVKKGDLDLYLVKPVNSQFMVSFRKVAVRYFVNLALVSSYLVWAILQLRHPVSLSQVASFLLLIPCGVGICYAIRFCFATLTVVLQDAGNIQFVWYQIYRLGTRPDRIYPDFLRHLVFTVMPVAFLASVPARMLVEGVQVKFLIIGPLLTLTLIGLANFCWRLALKHYASASS